MGFDLSTLNDSLKKQEEGVPVKIKHPATGEELGITIYVASYDSEKVRRVAREMGNKALLERRRNPRKADTVEAHEERTFAIAAAAIVGWEGLESEGKPLEFNRENARMIVERFSFVAEQIDMVAGDRANFFAN